MVEHSLKNEGFSLTLQLQVHEEDIKYPVNTVMTVFVNSNGFSCTADMDIDIKEMARFSKDLIRLYDSLQGTAQIQEPYGYEQFITFTGNGLGGIEIAGFLCSDGHDHSQKLQFENGIDQTLLKNFAGELYNAYKHYEK